MSEKITRRRRGNKRVCFGSEKERNIRMQQRYRMQQKQRESKVEGLTLRIFHVQFWYIYLYRLRTDTDIHFSCLSYRDFIITLFVQFILYTNLLFSGGSVMVQSLYILYLLYCEPIMGCDIKALRESRSRVVYMLCSYITL